MQQGWYQVVVSLREGGTEGGAKIRCVQMNPQHVSPLRRGNLTRFEEKEKNHSGRRENKEKKSLPAKEVYLVLIYTSASVPVESSNHSQMSFIFIFLFSTWLTLSRRTFNRHRFFPPSISIYLGQTICIFLNRPAGDAPSPQQMLAHSNIYIVVFRDFILIEFDQIPSIFQ